jgi:hypothetical protein
MGPSIAAVMRRRYWMSSLLRITALLMAVWGLLGFLNALLEHLPHLLTGGSPIVLAWMAMPLRWLVLAAALVFMERRLLTWIFPLPRQGCPQCGYPIAGRSFDVCPECGLNLGAPEPKTASAAALPGYPR